MGKFEEQQSLPYTEGIDVSVEQNAEARFGYCRYCGVHKLIGLRCLLVLLVSMAVFLSALFWLPPFLHSTDQRDLDLDVKYRDHDIVASFNVGKSVQLLEDNFLQLQDDIFDEIGVPTTKVVVLSLEPSAGSSITKVVFGVDSEIKDLRISSTAESLIRASFLALVVNQSSLHLTTSLFGKPFLFEVLKFPGGITVIPPQKAFLLQKVQILFNFTLNFSIYQIQVNFDELTSQLKSGLHLAPYENLYVSLSNSRGSTVAPPTTVQSSVLLAVGNTPSMPRLKQLARTITNSHSRNLGLNNTVFGRVKQVRLSSILQHSLHGGDGSGTGTSVSPSPAPLPYPQPQSHPHHHNHHHHHHHHHPHDVQLAPAIAPAPATEKTTPPRKVAPAPEKISPAPLISNEAKPPGCRNGIQKRVPGKTKKQSHLTPAAAPYISPHYSSPAPEPRVNSLPPAPVSSSIPPSSPLPNVVYAHVQPPSSRNPYEGYPGRRPSLPPSPLPSSSSADFHTIRWAFSLFLALVLHL
ncbi:uncharacterized protein LOC119998188 [Tripterygium wilfordii]|uniref:uncharacterized protein LOC119998188 n=1 Tax=Tripterygium wilfordii TaxID=458696 RepID=UPI0018F7F03E|nr:uncharacterized protein LOC119998188 [Tripterygium wilfordii]